MLGRGNGKLNSWTRTAFSWSLTLEPENKNGMKELFPWPIPEAAYGEGFCSRQMVPGCEIMVRKGEGCKGEGKGERKEGRGEREKAISKACLGQGGFFRHRY